MGGRGAAGRDSTEKKKQKTVSICRKGERGLVWQALRATVGEKTCKGTFAIGLDKIREREDEAE